MINKIFTFGDSFLSGHGVDSSDSWPAVIEQRLNVSVVNCSISGSSNKLNIIKFLENLEDITSNKNNLVLFAWTSPVRTTFYNIDNSSWENVQLGHYYQDNKTRSRVEQYYREYYNDYEGYIEFYQQQLLLTGFLDSRNIRYFYIKSFFDAPTGPSIVKDRDYLEKFIDNSKYLLPKRSIYDVVCVEKNMVCSDRFHPSKQGHIWLADYAIEFFRNNSII